ncbi:hypothetical protein BZA05DRAFT_139703 [Tricharina praecox]|uniref:uncharacterized protein n=1 Tax=Tricharina praecox TaxID=43433 RepID=UPI00221F30F7|nr:uncharacterized protein BZA05DRAFT_139703 [Tricharina praecox]KAI5846131.1 hypothetical protein BZA05DRAFT_139703 [Tricharina praecox]
MYVCRYVGQYVCMDVWRCMDVWMYLVVTAEVHWVVRTYVPVYALYTIYVPTTTIHSLILPPYPSWQKELRRRLTKSGTGIVVIIRSM